MMRYEKRLNLRVLTAISAGLLVAGLVWAQPPGGGRGRHFAPGDGPGPRGSGGRLAEFLELTEEQQEQWHAAHEEHAEASRGLHEQLRDNRVTFEETLSEPGPDPTTVGELFLAGRDLQAQLGESREQLEQTLKSFLTAEQIERWEAFEAARGDRGTRRFRAPRQRRGGGPAGV